MKPGARQYQEKFPNQLPTRFVYSSAFVEKGSILIRVAVATDTNGYPAHICETLTPIVVARSCDLSQRFRPSW